MEVDALPFVESVLLCLKPNTSAASTDKDFEPD
jgi:hypothetical protein